VDPGIFSAGPAVLGFYGQQLMAHLLGGAVEKETKASSAWLS
jgi:GMP synthase-like glutamine amidotransferase